MKKFFCIFLAAIFSLMLTACMGNNNDAEQEFREKAELFAESIINKDFDTAIQMPYFMPEHEYIRDDILMGYEIDGTHMVAYEINQINRLSDELYQIDGTFFYSFDDQTKDYESIFIPFYFLMDGDWHYAMNEYEVPAELLENVEYIVEEGALDPDTTIIIGNIQ